MPNMTTENPETVAAREEARQANGQFGAQEHSAPEAELNPRAELDAVNQLYWANTERVQEEVALYLKLGMPANAHRVEFEHSDQGDYVYAARAFDKDGNEIDTDEDYDRWANVDTVVSGLGHPDDARDVFRELFDTGQAGRGVYVWERAAETNEADGELIRGRIDKLLDVRRELASGSQAAAVAAVRRMLPEGSKVILTWGDQPGPDYLSVERVILADGTEIVDWDAADDAGIDWDEIDMAASDIRDVSDSSVTPVEGRRDYFQITQKAGE